MAITDVVKKKIGRELKEWIFLGIRTGARRSVAAYRNELVSNPIVALNHLKRAVDLPNRARARINTWKEVYYPGNNSGANSFLIECLTLAGGGVTLGEIDSELTTLENYCQNLVNQKNAETMSWDDVATSIESNVEWEALKWIFQLPEDYLDVWGE